MQLRAGERVILPVALEKLLTLSRIAAPLWLQESRYRPACRRAVEWFGRWGFRAMFIS